MTLDRNLQHIISTALQVGDFDTALPWLEALSSHQISQLTLPDQRTPLHYACQHGRVDVAQRLITNCQCSIESKDVQGCTPLHTAAQYGQVETLKYLLHRLFNHEVSGLTVKLPTAGKLSHILALMFQQKLSDRHRDQSGNTPLHTACVHGQLDIVQILTHEIGCDSNNTNTEGLSCLHLTAQHGHLPLVRYLVEEVGNDMAFQDEQGRTPLHHASGRGHLNVVRYFVDTHHCDPLCPDEDEQTPLHRAAEEGRLEVIKYFAITQQSNLLIKDYFSNTPLHLAALNGHLEVVKFLTEDKKCDPNHKGQFERTPLHHASERGHLDVTRYLVDTHHCDPLCPDEDKQTPLHRAAAEGKIDVVKYFATTQQSNWLIKDDFGNTPLHLAAPNGHLEVVKFLTDNMKNDPNLKGQFSSLPLHHASGRGHLDVVRYLVDTHHCDPLCPDKNKQTPLHRAAAEGKLEVVKYFAITQQSNLLIKDYFSNTPLHLASLSGHLDVVKFLTEDMKCDPKFKGRLARQPLHYASEGGHLDVVRYLVDIHHCDPLYPDENKQSPLHRAAANGKLEVLRYFAIITYRSNLLVKDYFSNTPLHLASLYGHLEVVKFLTENMEYGPKLKDRLVRQPLHHASEKGHLDVVRYLVDTRHCDPLCLDEGKQTPLHRAAANGKLEVVRYFATIITQQSRLLVKDCNNDTPLHFASFYGHLEIVKFLTEDINYDPKFKGQFARQPLHHASEGGHLDVVRYLVDTHHCDPLCQDENKQTPLHWAAAEGKLEVVRYFATIITQQGNLLIKDNFGNTPLHQALLDDHLEVVKFLADNMKFDSNLKGRFEGAPLHGASERGDLCPDINKQTPLHRAAAEGMHKLEALRRYAIDQRSNFCVSGKTRLHLAALNGELEVVKFLIEDMDCDPNLKDHYERTPLLHASDGGHLDVVRYLVDTHHCHPLCLDEGKQTPLHRAAANGKIEVIRYFATIITQQSNLLIKDSDTPLHLASLSGHLEVVKFLTEDMKCDPNLKDELARQPLHHASERGHLDVVRYLVDTHHCDPLCLDENKQTPLHSAAGKGKLEVVRYFATIITQQSNLLVKDCFSNTPLHLASFYGHLEVLRFLTEDIKCDPKLKGQLARQPLHHASERGHLDVVRYLLDTHHCDPLCLDENKQTPLHRAAEKGKLEVVRYFATIITQQNSLLIKDKFNKAPLHLASLCGYLEVVKFLTDNMKCDPNLKGQFEKTPLHFASAQDHLKVVRYLVDTHHCDPLCPDKDKRTPLHEAIASNCLMVVRYFVEGCRLDPYLLPDRKKLLSAAKDSTLLHFFKVYVDPLHRAVIAGKVELVRTYVEKKNWCPKVLDRYGNNALHYAAKYGQLEVVQYLTGFYATPESSHPSVFCDPQAKNKHGLTALSLAFQGGHYRVVSYLLRATTNQPVSEWYAISPNINIFVLGNSGSGKSTLVRALSTENAIFGKFVKVGGVTPLTAGIVPTTFCSQVFGRVNIYDFAGHEEYYASHEMILQHTAQPLVLLTVNISLPQDIEKTINYWLFLLSNYCFSASNIVHVLVIGSHADKVNAEKRKLIRNQVNCLVSGISAVNYHGFIHCDCRYSASDNLKQLRQHLDVICRSIRWDLTHQESDYSNRLCASLMLYLQQSRSDRITITVSKLHEQIKCLKPPLPILADFVNKALSLLFSTCNDLSSSGHLLFFKHGRSMERSVLVLDERVILSKAHACLVTVKNELDNSIGMLEEKKLKAILSSSMEKLMPPDLAIKYLLFTQFCTEVSADKLISVPTDVARQKQYFFPNLVLASRPSSIFSTDDYQFTHFYTWCLKCSNAHQFFTPRFIHTLFIQLVKCERDTVNTAYTIWKNGISFCHDNGTRYIIEVTDQTTRLYLAIWCKVGCELHLVKQRSMLISLIKSLAHKTCPAVAVEEFLLPPQTTYPPESMQLEIPLARVALAVIESAEGVAMKNPICR